MSVTGSNFACHSDVLQGITTTATQAELSPNDLTSSSDLAPGDPGSFLGFQFGPDVGVHPYNHGSLNQYLPLSKQSASPTPQPMDYFHYPSARFMSNQDSWNPLQVTGLPANVTFATRPMGRTHQMHGFSRRCSTDQYSTPSETGSQYNGLHSSDSGYSTRSCTTRSIAASYAVDSACSPSLIPHDYEQDEKVPPWDMNSTHHGDAMDIAEQPDSPSLLSIDTIKCEYPGCTWTGKCPSDKRKHEARHKKLFKCDEPNCARKEGFGTINDLARHKKCVHKKEPERGPKVLYMCFGHNCPRSNKKWPRLDNFRQHLARMHNTEDTEALLRKSQEWYEKCVKPHDIVSPSFTDNASESATPLQTQQLLESEQFAQDPHQELRDPIAPIHAAAQASDMLTLDSIKRLDEDYEMHGIDHFPQQPVELAALEELNFQSAVSVVPPPSQPTHNKVDKTRDAGLIKAATNLVEALTKKFNNNQQRPNQNGNEHMVTEQEGELSDQQRQYLHDMLLMASGIVLGKPGPSRGNVDGAGTTDKAGWIHCEFCPKQTRLRCEMKKHLKRHERPYGCTFYNCDKKLGSKEDWKRHELSQHYGIQSWQCTLPDPTQDGVPCARMFSRQEAYAQHLKRQHQVDDDEQVQASVSKNRLDWNGSPKFWCGFCRDIIHVQGEGLVALNQRFNHIDIEHYQKGERIDDWLLPSGHVTKVAECEDAAHDLRDAQDDDRPIMDDRSEIESVCSSVHSDNEHTMSMSRTWSLLQTPSLTPTQPSGPSLQTKSSTVQLDQPNQRKRKLHTKRSMQNLRTAPRLERRY
ncbi:hypothetical protein BJX66DRAFT_338226 [Aspergillus keveii]|uniref:C2H2-type domain-containing protein n=1 Tax=Aspergillus keveii TaxID=714993 RepID=A0ABR4G646_9EURO